MLRHFNLLVTIRVIFLIATITAFAFVLGKAHLVVNHFIIGVLIIAQVWELIRFLTRTNRDLSKVFNAIDQNDFSLTFQKSFQGKSFRELEESFNRILRAYKTVKIEREAQFHLLRTLVNQINVGIILIRDDSDIIEMNPAAERLTETKGVRTWPAFAVANKPFATVVSSLGESGRKLAELTAGGERKMFSIDVSTLLLLETPHRLIILQDINHEIEQKEIEAWHKLIRILTHEIMNSVTPIASLSETMQDLLLRDGAAKNLREINDDIIGDILFSLQTIHKRSEGLLDFVDAYRKFSKVPSPQFALTDVPDLLHAIEHLMREELMRKGIDLDLHTGDEPIALYIDRSLIEQVIINLLTNSIQALEEIEVPRIEIKLSSDVKFVTVEIIDNGSGIGEKELGQIFVPFFSTKPSGSGIGLSLSKQIMSAHGGRISVRSEEGRGTRFFLVFRRDYSPVKPPKMS
jgi:two-component system, NtrC family, nitrogen regulation sensor histidine kinase NtrY